jgi:hypothetical protein
MIPLNTSDTLSALHCPPFVSPSSARTFRIRFDLAFSSLDLLVGRFRHNRLISMLGESQ